MSEYPDPEEFSLVPSIPTDTGISELTEEETDISIALQYQADLRKIAGQPPGTQHVDAQFSTLSFSDSPPVHQHQQIDPTLQTESTIRPVLLSTAWKEFIESLDIGIGARTFRIAEIARQQSAANTSPKIYFPRLLHNDLYGEPASGTFLGLILSPTWQAMLQPGGHIFNGIKRVFLEVNDWAELINGIASAQTNLWGRLWLDNLMLSRTQSWLTVIGQPLEIPGIVASLDTAFNTWSLAPVPTPSGANFECALYALSYSWNAYQRMTNLNDPNPPQISMEQLRDLMFVSVTNDDNPSVPTPAYDALMAKEQIWNKHFDRNDRLQNRNFSEEHLVHALELLDESLMLGIINSGDEGAQQPFVRLSRAPSTDAGVAYLWVINDSKLECPHWEGLGLPENVTEYGRRMVKQWNFPKEYRHDIEQGGGGGWASHDQRRINKTKGQAKNQGKSQDRNQQDQGAQGHGANDINQGENDPFQDDDGITDTPSEIPMPATKKGQNRRDFNGRNNGPYSVKPWGENKAIQWDHLHWWLGEFVDDGKRKPHELKIYTYVTRLRKARHNMAIEKRPPPGDLRTWQVRWLMREHKEKITPDSMSFDAQYKEQWDQKQASRRAQNNSNRQEAARVRREVYNTPDFNHDIFGYADDPPGDGESDDDDLFDTWEAIEGDVLDMDDNEPLDPDRRSERYQCMRCKNNLNGAVGSCDFKKRRFPCTPCVRANEKKPDSMPDVRCVTSGPLAPNSHGPRDQRGPYFISMCEEQPERATTAWKLQKQPGGDGKILPGGTLKEPRYLMKIKGQWDADQNSEVRWVTRTVQERVTAAAAAQAAGVNLAPSFPPATLFDNHQQMISQPQATLVDLSLSSHQSWLPHQQQPAPGYIAWEEQEQNPPARRPSARQKTSQTPGHALTPPPGYQPSNKQQQNTPAQKPRPLLQPSQATGKASVRPLETVSRVGNQNPSRAPMLKPPPRPLTGIGDVTGSGAAIKSYSQDSNWSERPSSRPNSASNTLETLGRPLAETLSQENLPSLQSSQGLAENSPVRVPDRDGDLQMDDYSPPDNSQVSYVTPPQPQQQVPIPNVSQRLQQVASLQSAFSAAAAGGSSQPSAPNIGTSAASGRATTEPPTAARTSSQRAKRERRDGDDKESDDDRSPRKRPKSNRPKGSRKKQDDSDSTSSGDSDANDDIWKAPKPTRQASQRPNQGRTANRYSGPAPHDYVSEAPSRPEMGYGGGTVRCAGSAIPGHDQSSSRARSMGDETASGGTSFGGKGSGQGSGFNGDGDDNDDGASPPNQKKKLRQRKRAEGEGRKATRSRCAHCRKNRKGCTGERPKCARCKRMKDQECIYGESSDDDDSDPALGRSRVPNHQGNIDDIQSNEAESAEDKVRKKKATTRGQIQAATRGKKLSTPSKYEPAGKKPKSVAPQNMPPPDDDDDIDMPDINDEEEEVDSGLDDDQPEVTPPPALLSQEALERQQALHNWWIVQRSPEGWEPEASAEALTGFHDQIIHGASTLDNPAQRITNVPEVGPAWQGDMNRGLPHIAAGRERDSRGCLEDNRFGVARTDNWSRSIPPLSPLPYRDDNERQVGGKNRNTCWLVPCWDCKDIRDNVLRTCEGHYRGTHQKILWEMGGRAMMDRNRRWFCRECNDDVTSLRQQGTQDIRLRRCFCTHQLLGNWLCNAHQYSAFDQWKRLVHGDRTRPENLVRTQEFAADVGSTYDIEDLFTTACTRCRVRPALVGQGAWVCPTCRTIAAYP